MQSHGAPNQPANPGGVGHHPSARLLLIALALGLIPSFAHLTSPIRALASSVYASAVTTDAPSVFYPLNETSGSTAADDSGHGNDATYGSDVTLGEPSVVPSTTDTSVLTPSSGSTAPVYYTAGTGLPIGNSDRTFEMWIKTSSAAAVQYLFGYGDYTGSVPTAWTGLVLYDGDQIVLGDGPTRSGSTRISTSPTVKQGSSMSPMTVRRTK